MGVIRAVSTEEALGIAPPMVSSWRVERADCCLFSASVSSLEPGWCILGERRNHWIRLPSPLRPHTTLRIQTVAADAFPLQNFCLHCVQMCYCDWFNKDLTGQ